MSFGKTLPCDGQGRRRLWLLFSGVFIAVYPIGVPALLFGLMYRQRREIMKLQLAIEEHDKGHAHYTSAGTLAKRASVKERRPSIEQAARHTLKWLVKKFEKFKSGQYFMGVVFLVLRLIQTRSVLAS